MNQLTEVKNLSPALKKTLKEAQKFIKSRHSLSTRIAYESDIKEFNLWCKNHKLQSFPASVESVVLFLSWLAEKGLKPSSISRRVSALKYSHSEAGLPSPTDMEPVKATMAGIKRTKGSAPKQVAPATIEVVEQLLSACGDSKKGIRDQALITIGFGAALGRSELAAIKVEDIEITDKGLMLHLPKSKTDQEGKGQSVAILEGDRLQVKKRLGAWLEASGIEEGVLFPITPRHIANIIKYRAKQAGLNKDDFSGHSLRAGFITSAANSGADVFRVMDVSRHKSVNIVKTYVRRAKQFDDHAGQSFM